MSLLTSPAQSCPQLLNSQITRIDCAAHVQDVLDALIAPENSSLRKLARFLQVKERGGNCIRWRAQRMKRGRDVPERLGNMDSGDRLALAFVEWRAHLVRRLQQTIAQLSHLPEDDDSQALGGRGVCHLTVGSFRLPLPHGNSNGSENRQDTADGLHPRGPLNAGLGCRRMLGCQSPGQQSAKSEAHRTDDQRIPAELGPVHFHSGGGDGRILCHPRIGVVV